MTTQLEVRRHIAASAERLFDAWTDPHQLTQWWGPVGITCPHAEVDLRVGGRYRIENQVPDGATVIIEGRFLTIRRPHELIYTWRVRPGPGVDEQVTVRFEPTASGTEVVIVHERIADEAARAQHALGWEGCLDGLRELAEGAPLA